MSRTRAVRAWSVALGIVLSGGLGVAAASASGNDETLRERVLERLDKAGLTQQLADLQVSAQSGSVILDGAALTIDARLRAEKAALRESPRVDNRVRVVPEERPEGEIRKDVVSTILRYPHLTVFDSVEYGLEDGVLVLQGSVRFEHRKADIEKRLNKVSGLRRIFNEIAVQSTSLFDDRLRRQLAQAIYGDDRFMQYAHLAHPPIRIVVDRGRVTLSGVVNSPVEQVLLGHIARGSLAFAVENRVQVEGEPREEKPGNSSSLSG